MTASTSTPHRTPAESRIVARKMRGNVRLGTSVTDAADAQQVSRMHYYRMVEALEAWEESVTHPEQIAELEAQLNIKYFEKYGREFPFAEMAPNKWLFAGGQLLLDHIQGNDIGMPAAKVDPLLG